MILGWLRRDMRLGPSRRPTRGATRRILLGRIWRTCICEGGATSVQQSAHSYHSWSNLPPFTIKKLLSWQLRITLSICEVCKTTPCESMPGLGHMIDAISFTLFGWMCKDPQKLPGTMMTGQSISNWIRSFWRGTVLWRLSGGPSSIGSVSISYLNYCYCCYGFSVTPSSMWVSFWPQPFLSSHWLEGLSPPTKTWETTNYCWTNYSRS
jgi:hypothetical protein